MGVIRYDALIPCLVASFVGDATVRLWGVAHSQYVVAALPAIGPLLLLKVVLAGLACGAVSALFADFAHAISAAARRIAPNPVWRAALGGGVVVAATLLLGTRDYNGLSLPLLQRAFGPTGVPPFAFLLKLALTGLTLGVGFKGGEVTPLFVVGATLGATLGQLLGAPTDLMAAIGFIAVFAAAANTPLACVLMGVELFGAGPLPLLAIGTFVAYIASGHRGIYLSQRVAVPKLLRSGHDHGIRGRSLRELHQARRPKE
jgi:H+/Cl- antiporter ClcA